jgi:hypothetical protein
VISAIIIPDSNPTMAGPVVTCALYECSVDNLCVPGPVQMCRDGQVCCPGRGCTSTFECPITQ